MQLHPQRLLLMQTRWMGDVLLCTPAIREARRAFPEATIDFLTEPAGAEALARNPHLDAIRVWRGPISEQWKMWREVRRAKYDAVIDFRSTNATAAVAFASRAPIRAGIRGRGPRNRAYTRFSPRLETPTYAARHKLDMLVHVGVPVQYITDLGLDFVVSAEARTWARKQWRELRLEGKSVIALTGVSRERFKQWGTERWAAVGDALARDGHSIWLTWGPGEAEQAEAIRGAMTIPPIAATPTPDLDALAAVLERCDGWAGNDGGVKHLAAAVGLPTVSVARWQIGPVWTDATAKPPQSFVAAAPPRGCDLDCPSCDHLGCLAEVGEREVIGRVRGALTPAGPQNARRTEARPSGARLTEDMKRGR